MFVKKTGFIRNRNGKEYTVTFKSRRLKDRDSKSIREKLEKSLMLAYGWVTVNAGDVTTDRESNAEAVRLGQSVRKLKQGILRSNQLRKKQKAKY